MAGRKPKGAAESGHAIAPGELGDLLERIEAEPVPERLLVLAQELQKALAARRLAAEAGAGEKATKRRTEARV
jgi:hypothetical protein